MKRVLILSVVFLCSILIAAQDIEGFVSNQLLTYPKSRLLDIYKSCFQGYMGAEHLVSDRQSVKAYLDEEIATTSLDELMPWYYEPCGPDSCYYRVSIRAIKEGLITDDQLLDAFVRSANSGERPSVSSWSEQWHKIIGTIDRMKLNLPRYEEDKPFIDSILSIGKYAISHSPEYREAYHPHYRIMERSIFEKEIKLCLVTQERPVRVACVGNSVTYGYGLRHRDRDAYPVRLQQMLDSAYGARRYEVGNFGRSGATLLYKGHRPYINTPEFHQALDFKPDWVVIHLGLNDTDPRNWPDWKEEFIPNYRALIDSFRTVNPEARILVCQMTPIFDRHPRFRSGTRDWHAQIQEAIKQVAQGAGAQLIDLYTPLHCRPDLFPDALHPNPEGAQILATTVYGALTGDYGGLHLPPVYSSGMVLPRDEHLLIEGRANARCSIRRVLSKDGKVVDEGSTFTHADGSWSMELPHMKAGGPYTLTFTTTPLNPDHYRFYYPEKYPYQLQNLTKAKAQTLTIDSLYFGDLWLASGQSNMELRVDQCNTVEQDLADAARLAGRLHLYNMPARARTDAVEWDDSVLRYVNELRYMDFQGWKTASPEVVRRFSAVAFNFARVLCDSLPDIPIGIICNAVGGSTTESWIDRTTLEQEFPDILHDWRNGDYGQPWARGRMTQNIAHAITVPEVSPKGEGNSKPSIPLQRHPYEPCYLFEAAIAPLGHLPIKGVLWYQGESNAHNIEVHERLFTLLEQSWRRHFARRWNCEFSKKPVLPFYTVQLSSLPRPSWPAFRDSQRRLAIELPDTWMAVSSDVGDASDVHYRTKRPVGERLALQALCHTYGHTLECEGPTLRAAVHGQGNTIALLFDHADGLTCTRGFEIAGSDGLFYPADIKIEGNKILLSSPSVIWPTAVRYGWQGFTDADLRNAQGLPASTFQDVLR